MASSENTSWRTKRKCKLKQRRRSSRRTRKVYREVLEAQGQAWQVLLSQEGKYRDLDC